jgi:RING-H2 zinc finger domain
VPSMENRVRLARCGHIYHLACVEEWAVHYKQSTCPTCRRDIYFESPLVRTTRLTSVTIHLLANRGLYTDQASYELLTNVGGFTVDADWEEVVVDEQVRT